MWGNVSVVMNEAVEAGLDIARRIAAGDEPVLTHGWTIGTEQECNFCNDWQVANLVGLRHEDRNTLADTRRAAFAMKLSGNLPPNIAVSEFVFIRRPSVD